MDQICTLLEDGKTYKEIVGLLGVAKSTISYHATRHLGREPSSTRYDWKEIQLYHDAGNGVNETIRYFGMSRGTLHKARLRGDFISRPLPDIWAGRTKEEMKGSGNYQPIRKHARKVAEAENLYGQCNNCGWEEHQDVCHIVPVAEFSDDAIVAETINHPSNLVLLCPNCHWLLDRGKLITGGSANR